MNGFLLAAATLAGLGGVAHSFFGERLIFKTLSHQHLPTLRNSTHLTLCVLRFFWHVASIVWWGLAAQLVSLGAQSALSPLSFRIGVIIALIFSVTAIFSLVLTRARFRPAIILWAVAICVWLGLLGG